MDFMQTLSSTLEKHSDDLAPILYSMSEIDKEIDSGKYSLKEINENLFPAKINMRMALNKAKEAARTAGRNIIAAKVKELEAEDALDPSALTDDCKLLNSGVKLNARDINAMLERNATNRTMVQVILRYCRDNGIDVKQHYIGNEQNIRNVKNMDTVIDMFVDHWIDKPNAKVMLKKFFKV